MDEEIWRRTQLKGHNEIFYKYVLIFVTLGLYPLNLKMETVCSPKRWCPTRLRGVNIQKTEVMNNTRRENPKILKLWRICCSFRGLA
jgi:hypothetical protein